MDRDSDSSITGESQTPSPFPNGGGGNAGGTGGGMGSGWGNLGGMGGMPGMGGMGIGMGGYPGYYGMYPWMGGGMGGMPDEMGGMPGIAGGSRSGVPQSPFEDNFYRASLDHLTSGSEDPTPPETQYTGVDTFSLEGLGLSPMREQTPQPIGREPAVGRQGRGSSSAGRSKRKGKGKGVARESSQEGKKGEDVEGRRSVWTSEV